MLTLENCNNVIVGKFTTLQLIVLFQGNFTYTEAILRDCVVRDCHIG